MKHNKHISFSFIFLTLILAITSCSFNNDASSENSSTLPSSEMVISVVTSSESTSEEISSEVSSQEVSSESSTEDSSSLHVHEYSKETVSATCEEEGYDLYTCSCGDTYRDNVVGKLNHNYGAWELKKAPEEFASGLLIRTCINNDEHIDEHILPLLYESEEYEKKYFCGGHEIYSYTYYLDGQSFVFVDESLDGDLCDYESEIVPPTCEEDGYTSNVCTVCGDVYINDIVPSTGKHYYIEEIVEPTCDTKGYTIFECGCGESYIDDYVDKIDHQHVKTVVDPTCEEDGYDFYECECGDTYRENIVGKLNHDYGNWIVSIDPTSTSTGLLSRVCKNNDEHVDNYVLPKLNQEDYIYNLIEDSTCEKTGSCSYSYNLDGQTFTFTVAIELKKHDETITTIQPTSEEKGYDLHECKNCDYEYKDNYVDELVESAN